MFHEIRDTFKHIDTTGYLGNLTSLSLFGFSLSTVEAGMRLLCLIGSAVVGWVTYMHTQEKRELLRKQLEQMERNKPVEPVEQD